MSDVEESLPAHSSLHLGTTPWNLSSEVDGVSLCEQAEQAEAWGYDSFWLPEGHLSGRSSVPEPMMLLAAVAARTKTIKLGTTSYLLPIRHPLQAAEQIAVLDRLSNGRVIVGLGRGYQGPMLRAFGVEPGSKRVMFKKAFDTMLSAWRGEPIEGELTLAPLPVQKPHPPLWVAALGPKAIEQVALLGLPYIASPFETEEKLLENYALLESLGTRALQVPIMRFVFVSDDEERCQQVKERLLQFSRPSVTQQDIPIEADWMLIGSNQRVLQQITRLQERLGMTHLLVTQLRLSGISGQWFRESSQAIADMLKSTGVSDMALPRE